MSITMAHIDIIVGLLVVLYYGLQAIVREAKRDRGDK